MKFHLMQTGVVGRRHEIEAGMAGMNPLFYQRMLKELTEQIKLGDELGYDSVSFTEHHFHIEGFELSNNPVLLDLYFAMQTKRIRVGQLGIVLPASNPIRVAEDIAMLDHMLDGRFIFGISPGGLLSDAEAFGNLDADRNAMFVEAINAVLEIWAREPPYDITGKYWTIRIERQAMLEIGVGLGEQPGDQEDLAGKPFVGPAGRILERLAEIDAAAVDGRRADLLGEHR